MDYKNFTCRQRLVDKLVEECSENIDEQELHSNKMVYNSTLNDYEKICSPCTVYTVLLAIFCHSSVFILFSLVLKKKISIY